MKILTIAHQSGSALALKSPCKELLKRGHELTIYHTGSESEAKGFGNLPVQCIPLLPDGDYAALVKGFDIIVTGFTGWAVSEGRSVRAANEAGIPSVAVNDQNWNYQNRIRDVAHLPTVLAMMHESCREKMETELADAVYDGVREEAAKRIRVVGWTAYDDFAALRNEYTLERRMQLFDQISLDPEQRISVFFTQNIHPNTKYLEPYIRANPLEYRELRTAMFAYEMDITRAVFEAASDLEQELVVKPHPGEEFSTNFTKELAERHGFTYLPAGACNSRDLILASSAAAASRSAVLNESCLLDRNTAAIVPSIGDSEKDQQMNDVSVFPAASTGAIPIAYQWEEIKAVCSTIWSPERSIQDKLAQRRTLFSVDGKASQRLADIIEELVL